MNEVTWKFDEHGHLIITATDEFRAEIVERLETAREDESVYWHLCSQLEGREDSPYLNMLRRKRDRIGLYKLPSTVTQQLESEALESLIGNGFSLCDPADIGALTEATILTDDEGKFWSDIAFYAVESFVSILARDGEVRFNKAE